MTVKHKQNKKVKPYCSGHNRVFFFLLLSPPQINVQFQEGALLFWCSHLFKVVPGVFSSFRNCTTEQGIACSEGSNVSGTLTILQGDQPVAC